MKKLKLDVASVAVESFETALAAPDAVRGTVRAHNPTVSCGCVSWPLDCGTAGATCDCTDDTFRNC